MKRSLESVDTEMRGTPPVVNPPTPDPDPDSDSDSFDSNDAFDEPAGFDLPVSPKEDIVEEIAALPLDAEDPYHLGQSIHRPGCYFLIMSERIARKLANTPYPTRQTLNTTAPVLRRSLMPVLGDYLCAPITQIHVNYRYRREGIFTAVVEALLKRDKCVVIEDIRARWLKRRLAESPLWILQGVRGEEKEDCPRYARFVMNTPFTLF